MIFGMATSLLFSWILTLCYPDGLTTRSWWDDDEKTLLIMINIGLGIATVVVWLITYFRFKEWEIIKRW